MRRTSSIGWAPIAALALALHAGPGTALEKTKVVIGAATTGTFVSYPLALADKLGYFKAEGLDAEIVTFAGGTKAVQGLMGGTADYNVGLYEYTIRLQPQNQYLVSVFNQILYPGFAVGVRKPLADKVKTLKDLKGLKIANGAKGINFDFFLAKMMESVGLTYDVLDVVYMSYPDGIKALASKAVDAAFAPEPWGAQAEKEKIGVRLFLTEQVPTLASFQVAAIMYSGKFIKERPKVARAFMQSYVQGLKLYNTRGGLKDPEIAGILSRHLKLPVETIQATLPVYLDPSGKPRVQDLAAFQDWFHQMGWVKEPVPMDRVVDLSFLE